MKRWHTKLRVDIEDPKIEAFLEEMAEVCKKHGMALGHEDNHGAFIVVPYDKLNVQWMLDAVVEIPPQGAQKAPSFADRAKGFVNNLDNAVADLNALKGTK